MATFHENLVQSFHNFRDKYLKANGNFFKFSYDATTQKYGFTINGTFHPFKTVQASKTVAAGTSAKTVTPDSGYDGVASVTVNPTPSQTKSATAGTSAITVSPDSGKLLSSVTVNPTPSQTKSANPSTVAQTISPDSGKLLSSVSISAMPLPAVAAKWSDGTLNIIEGNLGSRGTCTDGVVRSVFEIQQGKYYGGRSARDLIGVTDDKMRQLGWKLSGEEAPTIDYFGSYGTYPNVGNVFTTHTFYFGKNSPRGYLIIGGGRQQIGMNLKVTGSGVSHIRTLAQGTDSQYGGHWAVVELTNITNGGWVNFDNQSLDYYGVCALVY